VEERGLHQLDGCRTIPQWAAHRFGMSRREAQLLLRAGRALRELPLIDRAFAEGRIGWSRVRELVRVAVPRHEQAWLDLARRLPIDELSLEVRLSRKGDPPRQRDGRKGLPEIRMRLNMPMPADVYAKWEQARRKLRHESEEDLQEWECLEALCDLVLSMRDDKADRRTACAESPYTVIVNAPAGGRDVTVETEDGPVPLDPLTAELIQCDRAADGERIPPRMRRLVLKRDGYRCRHCRSRFRLHEHHIIKRSEGGPTEPRNLLTLCRGCHALTHADLLVIVGDADSCRFERRDGVDLGGPEPEPAAFLPRPLRLSLPARTGDEPRTVCAPRRSWPRRPGARPGGP
jgi:HNH endonuclease